MGKQVASSEFQFAPRSQQAWPQRKKTSVSRCGRLRLSGECWRFQAVCHGWGHIHLLICLRSAPLCCAKKVNFSNTMHYLAPLWLPVSDFVPSQPVSLSFCVSVFVCLSVCLQGTARWTLRSSWRYWGPNSCHPTTGKASWATPLTTSSGRWKTKLESVSHGRHHFSAPSFFPPPCALLSLHFSSHP